jgi:hypothetical protein
MSVFLRKYKKAKIIRTGTEEIPTKNLIGRLRPKPILCQLQSNFAILESGLAWWYE